MSSEPNALFVYGTLKRGEERGTRWPAPPVDVQEARIRGRLLDLGSYPALLPGSDWVAGEIWEFRPIDMPITLQTIDQIECYGVDDVDLYIRREIICETTDEQRNAYTYYLADESAADRYPTIRPDHSGMVRWTATQL